MLSRKHLASVLRTLMVIALLSSCGDGADFAGSAGVGGQDASKQGGPKTPPPDDGIPGDGAPYEALYWFWQCESDPGVAPTVGSDNEVLVQGEGNHELDGNRINGTPLKVSGKMCPPEDLPRDIVFVIDVSVSMSTNDPVVGGTCGRMQAVETVLNGLSPNSDARLGLVTFSDDVAATSTQLFASKAELFQRLTAGGLTLADVLCQQDAGTDYTAAINGATSVLRTGRADASKEIYFVSDGRPNPFEEGRVEANVLKSVGVEAGGVFRPVTIATVMLGGTDQVLERDIASKDSDGRPLHAYVANAAQLATTLAALADNEIVGAMVKYRAIGETQFELIDLSAEIQDYEFAAPEITIEVGYAPEGIELEYEYWDKHDNRYVSRGNLVWASAPAP